jgi:hypothetical protein
MRSSLLAVSLCLISFLPAFSQANAQNEIPFELLPSGHIQVKAKVDGVVGNFIFDTGAGLTVFTRAFFDKLQHTRPQDGGFTGFRATGERVDFDLFTVQDFEMGSVKRPQEQVSYLDINLGGLDGIISLKPLEQQAFTLDFDKKVIRLETAAGLSALRKTRKVIPVELEEHRGIALDIFARFKVNDTLNLLLSLDSGAGKDVYRFNAKYMQRLGINPNDTLLVKRKERKSEINAAHVSSTYTTTIQQLAPAAVPGVSVSNPRVQFVEGLIYDGIIWINWLGTQITVNLPGKELLVAANTPSR